MGGSSFGGNGSVLNGDTEKLNRMKMTRRGKPNKSKSQRLKVGIHLEEKLESQSRKIDELQHALMAAVEELKKTKEQQLQQALAATREELKTTKHELDRGLMAAKVDLKNTNEDLQLEEKLKTANKDRQQALIAAEKELEDTNHWPQQALSVLRVLHKGHIFSNFFSRAQKAPQRYPRIGAIGFDRVVISSPKNFREGELTS